MLLYQIKDSNLVLISKPLQTKNKKHNLLFLHGFMGSSQDWLPIINQLKNEYNFFTIDLPMHGRSKYVPQSIENTTEKILDLLHKNNLNNIILVAYSMGGRIAWDLLCHKKKYLSKYQKQNNLVIKAIIESSSPGCQGLIARYKRRRQDNKIANQIINLNMNDFLNKWYQLPLFKNIQKHVNYKNLIKQRLKNNKEELALVVQNFSQGRQKNLWPKIKNINIPVLFISGSKDHKYTSIGKNIIQQNKIITHKIISASHNVHFEKSTEFIKVLQSFL